MAADEAQGGPPESELADQASFVGHDLCDSAVQSSVETSVDANHGTAGKWRRVRGGGSVSCKKRGVPVARLAVTAAEER